MLERPGLKMMWPVMRKNEEKWAYIGQGMDGVAKCWIKNPVKERRSCVR